MKRPTDRGPVRSPRRFNGRAVRQFAIICTIFASGHFSAMAGVQTSPRENNSTRSISGQFIILPPEPAPRLNVPPRIATTTNLVRLEPALLAVSAERIKELVWHKLDLKGQW